MTIPPQEPDRRKTARADFLRMVRSILAIGVVMVIGALIYLSRQEPLQPAVIVATIAGVFFSIVIGCGLFAAAFFSDKSGHDDEANGNRRSSDRGR